MTYFVFVTVINGSRNLTKQSSRLNIIKFFSIWNIFIQFSSRSILHDKDDFFFVLKDFKDVYDVRMLYGRHDLNFSPNSNQILFTLNLWLFDCLDCDLKVGGMKVVKTGTIKKRETQMVSQEEVRLLSGNQRTKRYSRENNVWNSVFPWRLSVLLFSLPSNTFGQQVKRQLTAYNTFISVCLFNDYAEKERWLRWCYKTLFSLTHITGDV